MTSRIVLLPIAAAVAGSVVAGVLYAVGPPVVAIVAAVCGGWVAALLSMRAMTRMKARQEAAQAADQAKSRMLAVMSHELRTPMSGVLGMLELLADHELPPSAREQAALARTSGNALLALVNDILDFARIESGGLQLERAPFSIDGVMDEIAAFAAAAVGRKPLRVIIDLHPEVPMRVIGDRHRLRQILINLVGNALKFTDRGRIVVSVVPAADDTVAFAVEDSGIGISAEVQGRLFRPFVQADVSTARVWGGSGLGLSICKSLVEAMGGTIAVASEPGRGARFAFAVRLSATDDTYSTAMLVIGGAAVFMGDPVEDAALRHQLARIGVRAATPGQAPFLVVGDDAGLAAPAAIAAITAVGTQRVVHLVERLDQPHQGVPVLLPVRMQALRTALLLVLGRPTLREREPAAGPLRFAGRVLVVEDQSVNQRVITGYLGRHGIVPVVAGDGREALELLAHELFDLVLMDCHLPDIDGYTATRLLRRREAAAGTRRTPVVAFTADFSAAAQAECLAAGMDGFIGKPVDVPSLTATLAAWLAEAPLDAPPAPVAPAAIVPPAPAAVDERVLARLRDMLGDQVDGILDSFRRELDLRLPELQAAAAAQDRGTLRRIAHQLRGAAHNLGCTGLGAACGELERRAREGDPSAGQLVPEVVRLASETNAALARPRTASA